MITVLRVDSLYQLIKEKIHMPNHITNKITVLEGHYNLFKLASFNNVVPMPQELIDTTHGNVAIDLESTLGITKYFFGGILTLRELHIKYPNEDITKLLTNYREHGHITWYSWSIANWGTKWDMYDTNCEDNVLSFLTAWNAPDKFYQALADTLDDNTILSVEYADEDIGYNAGVFVLSKESVVHTKYDADSKVAWELAIKLHGLEEDVHLVNGKWAFKED